MYIAVLIALLLPTYPDSQKIPLDKVWGYELPGTKNIRKLEPKRATGNLSNQELISGSLVLQIYKALQNRPGQGEKAGPAFVVVGRDEEALKNAHAVMMTKDKKEPPRILPANTDLSLVFYSYTGGRYVRLVSVEQSERLVKVNYQMISHRTTDQTVHFALIPLAKIPKGAVNVKIEQVQPVNDKGEPLPLKDDRNIVCDTFSFSVEEPK